MNPYDPPKANIIVESKRSLGAIVIGILCITFGGLILLSNLAGLLGLITSHAQPQTGAEALGRKIGGILVAVIAGYLVLYGFKKLKKPAPTLS